MGQLKQGLVLDFGIRSDQVSRSAAKRLRQLEERYHRRVPQAALEIGQILLAMPGEFFELLLGEAALPADTRKIPSDELAHIHAAWLPEPRSLCYLLS